MGRSYLYNAIFLFITFDLDQEKLFIFFFLIMHKNKG